MPAAHVELSIKAVWYLNNNNLIEHNRLKGKKVALCCIAKNVANGQGNSISAAITA